jgi:secreted trypsin-like serine protease
VPAVSRAVYGFTALLRVAFKSGNFQCGGTLIAPDVILTAAHCLFSDPDAAAGANATERAVHGVTALLGWLDTTHFNVSAPSVVPASETRAETITARAWTWHERYDVHGAEAVLNAHDIALVFLSRASVAAPARLDWGEAGGGGSVAPGAGASTLALGWGLTRALRPDDAVAGSVATKLQRVRIPLAAASACDAQAAANGNAYDDTRQVCGATTGGVDTCYVRATQQRQQRPACMRACLPACWVWGGAGCNT